MSKHSSAPTIRERYGAAIATVCLVGVLALAVTLLVVFPSGGTPKATDPAALTDVAGVEHSLSSSPSTESSGTSSEPSSATASSTAPVQQVIHRSSPLTIKPEKRPDHAKQGGQQGGNSEKDLRRKVQDSLKLEPTSFRVATFNVLGGSHTAAGGNKADRPSGTTRMAAATSVIQGSGADIVGLQELEIDQARTFLNRTGGGWGLYPGPGGGTLTVRNSVAWRTSVWELVSSRTVPIPYFRGNRVPMPVVELRNRASGQTVFVMNIHNPASNPRRGQNQRWRNLAMSIELSTVRSLQDQAPVLLTGDFNERSEAICQMTSGGTMRAAATSGSASGCSAPANSGIDWIFGTTHIDFSGYVRQRSALVSRATDHPFVVSDATIAPEQPTAD